jgi:hypothetical protein
MRFLDTNSVFAISALANLCLAIIAIIVLCIGNVTPPVVALNAGSIVLAIIAFAATAFLYVRNDQQKHFLMALAASSSTRR